MLGWHASDGLTDHFVGDGGRDLADRGLPRGSIDADEKVSVDVPSVPGDRLRTRVFVLEGNKSEVLPTSQPHTAPMPTPMSASMISQNGETEQENCASQ